MDDSLPDNNKEKFVHSLMSTVVHECFLTGFPSIVCDTVDVEITPSKLGTDRSILKRDVTATLRFRIEFREVSAGERKVLEKLGDGCVQPISIINDKFVKVVVFPLLRGQNCLDAIADGSLDHELIKKKILEIHDKLFGLWMNRKKGRPQLQDLYINRMRERINNINGAKINDNGKEFLLERLLRTKLVIRREDQVFRLNENVVTMLEKSSEQIDSVAPPEKSCIDGDPYPENIVLIKIAVSSDASRKEYIARLVDTVNATCDGAYDFDVVKVLNTRIWYHLWIALKKTREEEQEYVRSKLNFGIEEKENEFVVTYTLPDVPQVIEDICCDIEKKAAVYAQIIEDKHLEERKEVGLAMVQLCVAGKIAAEHPEVAAILVCEGGISLQKFLDLTGDKKRTNGE